MIHIYGLALNHEVSPSLADMCGIKYWRYDFNGSVRPEYIHKFDWAPAKLECPNGRIMYLPRYRRERKSLRKESNSLCTECLYGLFCPLLTHCQRDDPGAPLHCNYINDIAEKWINEGKTVKGLYGAYQFELWAENESDIYKTLFDSIKGLPLDSPRVIKVVNFLGSGMMRTA